MNLREEKTDPRFKGFFWKAQKGRRGVQLFCLALFLLLFFWALFPVRSPIPVDLFLRLSLLNVVSSMLASREWIPSLALWGILVTGVTLLLGRIFCGWICPLGTILDITDRLFAKRVRRPAMRERRWRNGKFFLLIAVGISALLGVQIAFLFDPIALLLRTFTWAFYAPLQLGYQLLGERVPFIGGWITERFRGVFPEALVHYRMGFWVFLLFLLILLANGLSPRFWCRNLCPLGALLGLLSPFSLLRKRVSGACDRCRICANLCKMQAIDYNRIQTHPAECVLCMSCVALCPVKALRYGLHWGDSAPAQWKSEPPQTSPRVTRRQLIFAGLAGLAWASLARTNAGAELSVRQLPISSPFLIRPPGSLPEEEFLSRCLRCGLCMKVCPTGGLQPALSEAGLEGFWTPVLVPRMGECAPECTACGEVCPTQAIQPFTAEEKNWIYIGTSVIDHNLCLVWSAQKQCLVCDEVCTYKAIEWRLIEGVPHPFVNEHKCVGCGLCEARCPVQPQAAIRVYNMGDKRTWDKEKQKRWRELGERRPE